MHFPKFPAFPSVQKPNSHILSASRAVSPLIQAMQTSSSEQQLQGGFLPKEQRVRVAREVRKTHFTLGSADYGYGTTQLSHFPAYTASPTVSGLENAKKTHKSHINSTENLAKAAKISEFQAKFQPHDLSLAAVAASQETKADLRKHHFQLGSSPSALQSSMRSAFPAYLSPAQTPAAIQLQAQSLRKHNFQLGTRDFPYASTAKLDYTPKKTEGWGKEEKLIQFRRDLRASHFQVGANPQSFVSLSHKDFSAKQFSARSPARAVGGNLVLGTSEEPWASTNHLAFTGKTEGKQGLEQERKSDLRASHFTLGSQSGSFQSVARETFRPQPNVPFVPIKDAGLRKSHFTLGSEGNTWSTVYQETHLGQSDGQVTAQRDRNADKTSHVVIGADPGSMVSQASATYRPLLDAQPGKLETGVEQELRGHHFQLGQEARNFTRTSNDYTGAPAEPGRLDPDLKRDLRTHHFTYGEDGGAVVSRMQSDYQPRQGPPAHLAAEQLAYLHKSHFGIGADSGNLHGPSEYKGQYHWVQPVPDTSYHFTFD